MRLHQIIGCALAATLSTSAYGLIVINESFDTDPAARGWGGVANAIAPNNYGFSNTDNTGSAVNPTGGTATGAGEVGGFINRGPNSFYGVDLGGPVDFKTNDMNIKGVLRLTARGSSSTLSLGWSQGFATATGPGNGETGAFAGMRWDDGFNGSGGLQVRGDGFGIDGGTGPSLPDPNTVDPTPTLPFEMNWDTDGVGSATLTMNLNGVIGTATVSGGDFNDIPMLTHWGMFGRTNASPDNGNTLWIDDLTFTAVPEPASMCLLALGGLVALRRRR
jgi:PEP-CTERM motif